MQSSQAICCRRVKWKTWSLVVKFKLVGDIWVFYKILKFKVEGWASWKHRLLQGHGACTPPIPSQENLRFLHSLLKLFWNTLYGFEMMDSRERRNWPLERDIYTRASSLSLWNTGHTIQSKVVKRRAGWRTVVRIVKGPSTQNCCTNSDQCGIHTELKLNVFILLVWRSTIDFLAEQHKPNSGSVANSFG